MSAKRCLRSCLLSCRASARMRSIAFPEYPVSRPARRAMSSVRLRLSSSSSSWMAVISRVSWAGSVSEMSRSMRAVGRVDVAGSAVGAVGGVMFQHARPWGLRLVVDGPPASVAPLFDAYGFAGGGEQVQQQVGLRPQLVEQVELLLGVVAPVGRELAHDVVVPGLDGGLVVLPVRAAPGLLDVLVLEPVDELVVDGLRAVVGVEAGDGKGEQGIARSTALRMLDLALLRTVTSAARLVA